MKAPHQQDPNLPSGERQRLVVAVVISLLILFGFNHFYEKPRLEAQRQQQEAAEQAKAKAGASPDAAVEDTAYRPRADVLGENARIQIKGKRIAGSLSLKGARIDDLSLLEHFQHVGSNDPVVLLAPSRTPEGFYFESSWVSDTSKTSFPTSDTLWSLAPGSADEIVSGGKPVVLQWDNGDGLLFEKTISLDDNFMFETVDRVTNKGTADVRLNAYNLVARNGLPVDFKGFFVLHEGPVGYLGGKEETVSYKEMRKGEELKFKDVNGWFGINDIYWMVTMLPEADAKFHARAVATEDANGYRYQTDIVRYEQVAAAGQSVEEKTYLYAGVKNLDLLNHYADTYGFKQLDLAIDFGMWYFIVKPFFYLLHFLFTSTGSIAIAILLMTVIVRGFVFPLANKSFRSMAKMKTIAPMLKEIQEKHKNDRAKLQMEIMQLYQREQVNPFSGCWPIMIQIPIFFALYKCILLSVELRHAPFFDTWIKDLSAPDPTSVFNLFGLIPWNPPQMLMIGAWPLLFCLSMIIQKRLSPPMPDAVQERIQAFFPYFITLMMAHFASGLVIYWTWSNVLGILQQYYILKKVGGEETSLIRGHASRRKSAKK